MTKIKKTEKPKTSKLSAILIAIATCLTTIAAILVAGCTASISAADLNAQSSVKIPTQVEAPLE